MKVSVFTTPEHTHMKRVYVYGALYQIRRFVLAATVGIEIRRIDWA